VTLSYHDSPTSFLEGVFARGDRRIGEVILSAFKKGCRLDGWSECFEIEKWLEAFSECGVDTAFYANRARDFNEIFPWEHFDYGVTKEFFIRQNELAKKAVTTPNCRISCAACGANCYKGGVCYEKR
jgi:hypothetical protein